MLEVGSLTNFGIIDEEFETQYLIGGRHIHKSLVQEEAQLSVDSIISKLKAERGDGFITLYHGTDIESYNKIMESGTFGDGDGIYFFTDDKSEARDYAKMKSKYRGKPKGEVLKLRLPVYAVSFNEGSYEYETKFMLKYQGNGLWTPVINTGIEINS